MLNESVFKIEKRENLVNVPSFTILLFSESIKIILRVQVIRYRG